MVTLQFMYLTFIHALSNVVGEALHFNAPRFAPIIGHQHLV